MSDPTTDPGNDAPEIDRITPDLGTKDPTLILFHRMVDLGDELVGAAETLSKATTQAIKLVRQVRFAALLVSIIFVLQLGTSAVFLSVYNHRGDALKAIQNCTVASDDIHSCYYLTHRNSQQVRAE